MFRIFQMVILSLTCIIALQAQSEIDFRPKLLVKELASSNNNVMPVLSEINLPLNLAEQIYPGAFFSNTTDAPGNPVRYVYIGRVNSCRSDGCLPGVSETAAGMTHEYFDYYILFSEKGIVQRVRVYNYQATHGEGITAPGWLKQFSGYDGERGLTPGKDVDAISGATISVYGISLDVQDKTRLLQQFLRIQSSIPITSSE